MSLPPLFIDVPRNPILAVGIPVMLGEFFFGPDAATELIS
jgi:hypothetical protein